MRLLRISLFCAGTLAAQNPHTTAADAAAGAKIFRSHCADCHGLNGQGGKGPDLTTGVFYHGGSDAALFKNITDGIEGTAMPGVFFSADQVWQIVTHVRSLAATGSMKKPGGDAARGRALMQSKGCLGCHLVKGQGGTSGPDLSVVGSQRPVAQLRQSIVEPGAQVNREYWRADIEMENGTAHQGLILNEDTYYVQILHPSRGLMSLPKRDFRKFAIVKTSAMPAYKGRLTDAELDDLVAYLWSLQRPRRTE
jgi:putative heme-binding domain-containing protein